MALAVAVALAAGIIAFAVLQPVKVLPLGDPAPIFELVGIRGEAFRSHERDGRIVLYFLGVSRDRDRTGPVLASMAGVAEELLARGWLGSRVELAFITLDPEHDTPAELARLAREAALEPYTVRQDGQAPGVSLLTGSPVAVKLAVGTGFGVYYEPPAFVDGSWRFVYEPAVIVVDGGGRIRARRPGSTPVWALVRDTELLVKEADARGASRLLFAGAHLFLCYVP
ncbi:MAG TPA: SCO family protein [Limnochorda sp.]